RRHGTRILELGPRLSAGHEILAHAARDAGDEAALEATPDRAIELGSRDAWIYMTRGNALLNSNWRDNAFVDDVVATAVAERAAALYMQAIALQPRSEGSYLGLVTAVLNLDTVTPDHRRVIDFGRTLF